MPVCCRPIYPEKALIACVIPPEMPQPLSSALPAINVWNISSDPPEIDPELAVLICKTFAVWASIEAQLEVLFVSVIDGTSRAANAVFEQLRSYSDRTLAIDAAAQHHLQKSDYIALQAVLQMITSSGKFRHRLAHHIWGKHEKLPGALTLSPPRVHNTFGKELRFYNRAHRGGTLNKPSESDAQEYIRKTLVFTKKDIVDGNQKLHIALKSLIAFQSLIDARHERPTMAHIEKALPGTIGTVSLARRNLMSIPEFRLERRKARDKRRQSGDL